MEQEKLTLKQILACADHGYKNAWKEFTDSEKKSVNFWLLNRYMSSVNGNRAAQERAVIITNEVYNKNFNSIKLNKDTGHSELAWQLLCVCGSGKQQFHKWIGYAKKSKEDNERIKILEEEYPHLKSDEVKTLARILTEEQIKKLVAERDERNG